MASTVQYLLEESIPELEDLEKKGYFSRSEIKQIVRKRQDFEYLLKRRAALKQDFLRYIDYETKLEELRLLRKKKLGIPGKKSLAEVAILRRIHFIYERAARKFKGDLDLWLRWIEFCKKYKSTKKLSKVITKALQRHATTSLLWVEAACWEFEHNANVAAARSLMQQGIRMCKKDESIWVEYYRMELLYVHKLRARREVLGLDTPSAGGGGVHSGDADMSAEAVKAVLSGAVARVVYKNAITALPDRLGFRAKFLAVLSQFSFDGVAELQDLVVASVRNDMSKLPEAWDVLARHQAAAGASASSAMFHADAHAAACSLYQEGVQALPSDPRIYELFVTYLCEVLGRLMEAASQPEDAVQVAAQLFEVLQRAHNAHCASPQAYLTWVDWAQKVKQDKMALRAARKACERHPASVELWSRRLQLELSLHGAHQHSASELFGTLSKALQSVQPAESTGLWLMAIAALPAGSQEFKLLCDQLEATCARVATKYPSGGLGRIAAALVQKTRDGVSFDASRQLYQRLLRAPAAGGDLFRCALQMEQDELERASSHSAAGSSTSGHSSVASARALQRQRIGALFEAAVAAYGSTESDLWLEYAQWLVRSGQGAGQVYWRATRELADPADFIDSFREKLGHTA